MKVTAPAHLQIALQYLPAYGLGMVWREIKYIVNNEKSIHPLITKLLDFLPTCLGGRNRTSRPSIKGYVQ